MNRKQIIPFLTTKSLHPENQESPIHFLPEWLTPIRYFYRRNHFPYPLLTQHHYWIQISGRVHQPRFFHYNEIISMPAKSLIVPLECAGNKRAHFNPNVYGEQWEEGAISQGKWTGVPLKDILEKAGDCHKMHKKSFLKELILVKNQGSMKIFHLNEAFL